MPTGDPLPVRRDPAAVEPPLFVPPDAPRVEEPSRAELILRGRIALAQHGADPDTWVDPDTEAEMRSAESSNTADLIRWAFGAAVTYCGLPHIARKHDPMSAATVRRWIKDHWEMTRVAKDGQVVKRGRRGQPYAPGTVELRVYLVAMVCNRLGWLSPTRDPKVAKQLEAYRIKFENAGYKTFEPDPMTPGLSVRLVREACDLGILNGLRNATAFRLQFDTGCRAAEMVGDGRSHSGLQLSDVTWLDEYRVRLRFVQTKGRKPRDVYVQGLPTLPDPNDPAGKRQIPNPDWDCDPVRLLGLWMDALRSTGITEGPLFREVTHAPQRRLDFAETGIYAGNILRQPWSRNSYQQCWDRAVAKSGIDIGPRDTRLRLTTHSNRAGMITAAAEAGMPLEKVAPRTGHSPGSPVIQRYFRSDRRWDDDNPGVLIRQRKAAEDAEVAARAAASRARRGRKKPS